MHIRYGYSIRVHASQPGAAVVRLDIHPDARGEITEPDNFVVRQIDQTVIDSGFYELDRFENICRTINFVTGFYTIEAEGIAYHSGFRELVPALGKEQTPIEPVAMLFLKASELCDLDNFDLPPALHDPKCNIIECILQYINERAWPTDTQRQVTPPASQTLLGCLGSSTDRIHLAIALCRKMGIPARYCQGYRCGEPGDDRWYIGHGAWFEAFVQGRWWTLDLERNDILIGRLLVARGRDATDIPTFVLPAGQAIESSMFFAEEVLGDRFPVTSLDRRQHWQRQRTLKPS